MFTVPTHEIPLKYDGVTVSEAKNEVEIGLCDEKHTIKAVFYTVNNYNLSKQIVWFQTEVACTVKSVNIPTNFPTEAINHKSKVVDTFYHGNKSYSVDTGDPITVTNEEDSILQAFLDKQASMDTKELSGVSGVTNVSRTLKCLINNYGGMFQAAVRMPSRKNGGGYYIRVTAAVEKPISNQITYQNPR